MTEAENCENEHCDGGARYACESDGLLPCPIYVEENGDCELTPRRGVAAVSGAAPSASTPSAGCTSVVAALECAVAEDDRLRREAARTMRPVAALRRMAGRGAPRRAGCSRRCWQGRVLP